jgi:hypothetical protein
LASYGDLALIDKAVTSQLPVFRRLAEGKDRSEQLNEGLILLSATEDHSPMVRDPKRKWDERSGRTRLVGHPIAAR